jgi:hypothetical protein
MGLGRIGRDDTADRTDEHRHLQIGVVGSVGSRVELQAVVGQPALQTDLIPLGELGREAERIRQTAADRRRHDEAAVLEARRISRAPITLAHVP